MSDADASRTALNGDIDRIQQESAVHGGQFVAKRLDGSTVEYAGTEEELERLLREIHGLTVFDVVVSRVPQLDEDFVF
jgi:hypothetical protein